jgi:hypothetical protein
MSTLERMRDRRALEDLFCSIRASPPHGVPEEPETVTGYVEMDPYTLEIRSYDGPPPKTGKGAR